MVGSGKGSWRVVGRGCNVDCLSGVDGIARGETMVTVSKLAVLAEKRRGRY